MKYSIVYPILFFVLLPIAAVLGLSDIILLPSAMANPLMMITLFLVAAIVLYVFSSFHFFRKSMKGNQTTKLFMKDFIKVNAYVSIGFSVLTLSQSVGTLLKPQLLKTILQNVMVSYASMSPKNVSVEELTSMMQKSLIITGIFSLLMMVHISFSLKYVKQYESLFQE